MGSYRARPRNSLRAVWQRMETVLILVNERVRNCGSAQNIIP
jgi:hypothetical protein